MGGARQKNKALKDFVMTLIPLPSSLTPVSALMTSTRNLPEILKLGRE